MTLNVIEFVSRSLARGKLSAGACHVWKLSMFLRYFPEKIHVWHFLRNLL